MSNDIYTPPQSVLVDATNDDQTLASRWRRLWASMIDTLTILAISVPAMFFTGAIEDITNGIQPSVGYNLAIGGLGIIAFITFNGKFLISNGQTIGKKVLGIKIVDLEGNLPSVKSHFLKRYAILFFPGQIPVVGQVFSFINVLFIFGKQKRCIHDYIAGTKVINC